MSYESSSGKISRAGGSLEGKRRIQESQGIERWTTRWRLAFVECSLGALPYVECFVCFFFPGENCTRVKFGRKDWSFVRQVKEGHFRSRNSRSKGWRCEEHAVSGTPLLAWRSHRSRWALLLVGLVAGGVVSSGPRIDPASWRGLNSRLASRA